MRDILAGLNEPQQQAVTTTEGPVLVLAGAGSGKTRVLIHRLAYVLQKQLSRPEELLAVTFTNKAAGEMKQRIKQLVSAQAAPTAIGTFHSLGARLLREQATKVGRSTNFTILDTKDGERTIKRICERLNISTKEFSTGAIRQHLSKLKNEGVDAAAAHEQASTPLEEVGATILPLYQQDLARADGFDFDDLLIEPVKLLTMDDAIRRHYQNRWRYLSVDEYQDTNAIQDTFIRLLLGQHNNLCVVGDDYQAIYSWRGANVHHILRFEERFPGCTTVYLTQNYRSTQPILQAANTVIAENKDQKHKELWTDTQAGTAVESVETASDRSEAQFVQSQVSSHIASGGQARDCAVLYRTNAQSRLFEEAFMSAGIPYVIVGGLRFYERAEVKTALALVQVVVNPNALIAWQRLLDVLVKGVGAKSFANVAAAATSTGTTILDVLSGDTVLSSRQRASAARLVRAIQSSQADNAPADLITHLISASGLQQRLKALPDGEDRIENVNELVNVAAKYGTVTQFLEAVALLTDIDEVQADSDHVWCMTLHASKGLEFPRVFVAGLEEDLLPHSGSQTHAELEEERRLFYVGMTRAQTHLTLTRARSRAIHGTEVPQQASRFLQPLSDVVQEVHAHEQPSHESLVADAIAPETSSEPVYSPYETGDWITHPHFGRGVIVASQGSTVQCIFEGHGMKQIDAQSIVTPHAP